MPRNWLVAALADGAETTRLATVVSAVTTMAISNRRNDRVLRDGADEQPSGAMISAMKCPITRSEFLGQTLGRRDDRVALVQGHPVETIGAHLQVEGVVVTGLVRRLEVAHDIGRIRGRRR